MGCPSAIKEIFSNPDVTEEASIINSLPNNEICCKDSLNKRLTFSFLK